MAISKLSMSFVDGSTVIDANKMNAIVSKINELVDKANGSSSGGGSSDSGGSDSGGQQTPTAANLFILNDSTFGVGINSSNGQIVSNTPVCTSGYIAVKANTNYTFKGRYIVAWYDSSKNFISASPSSESSTLTLTAPSNAAYCRFAFNYEQYNALKMVMNEGDSLLQGTQDQSLPNYPNLVDTSAISEKTGLQSSNGTTVALDTYRCTDYTPIKANTKYTFKCRWVVAFYDSSKNFISSSPSSESAIMTLTSPSNAAYCRFSVTTSTAEKYVGVNEGDIACNLY